MLWVLLVQVFSKLHRSVGLRLVLQRMGGRSTWGHARWYVRENALKVLMAGLLACPRDRSRFSTEQLVDIIGGWGPGTGGKPAR